MKLQVRDGKVRSPIYDDRSNARNWMARVEPDPNHPKRVVREFLFGTTDSYALPGNLKRGNVLEIAADNFKSRHKRSVNRRYGVVLAVNHEEVQLEIKTSSHACFARARDLLRDGL